MWQHSKNSFLIWKKPAEANKVQFSDIAKQVGNTNDTWLLYSKYIDAVDENCVQTMLSKWESRLGGAKALMSTHCFAMTEAGRVNPSVNAILQNSTMTALKIRNTIFLHTICGENI